MAKLVKPDVSIEEALEEPEKWITEGGYCYKLNFDVHPYWEGTAYLCPFWERVTDKGDMENGYCHYLKVGDWETNGYTFLWDQVKECGINDKEYGNGRD